MAESNAGGSVKCNMRNLILDNLSLFPLHCESIRSLRTPAGASGWHERKAALRRRRSTAAAENRDGGGAPGGAARPKQAVRASGSSVARATPEAWAGGDIRPRGVAHDPAPPGAPLKFFRSDFVSVAFGKTRTQTKRAARTRKLVCYPSP